MGESTHRVTINQPPMGKISSHPSCLADRVPGIVDPRHLLRSRRDTPLRRAGGAEDVRVALLGREAVGAADGGIVGVAGASD